MIKLIASDMDGTLLNNNHDIDKETVKAIKEAESKGIIFTIATGRNYEGVKHILDRHNIKCQCILSNGAEYRDEYGNIINKINMDKERVRHIIRVLEENKLHNRIMTNEGMFTTSSREEAFIEGVYRTMSFNQGMDEEEAKRITENDIFFTTLKYIKNIEEFLNSEIEIRKFVGFHNDRKLIKKIVDILSDMEDIAVSSSFRDNIEITDIKAQKGICLEQVCEKMNINKKQVMIIGDSFNDYSMFEVFEETVAMGNAIKEVKDIAKYITDTNDKLGVAKAVYNSINGTMEEMIKS